MCELCRNSESRDVVQMLTEQAVEAYALNNRESARERINALTQLYGPNALFAAVLAMTGMISSAAPSSDFSKTPIVCEVHATICPADCGSVKLVPWFREWLTAYQTGICRPGNVDNHLKMFRLYAAIENGDRTSGQLLEMLLSNAALAISLPPTVIIN